jgi:hypothetical protein
MGKLLNLKPWLASEDQIIAGLLGLTLDEYRDLSHSGIREVRDMDDNVLYYYMIVSPLNPDATLSKLKMNKSRMIFLPPDYQVRKSQLSGLF